MHRDQLARFLSVVIALLGLVVACSSSTDPVGTSSAAIRNGKVDGSGSMATSA